MATGTPMLTNVRRAQRRAMDRLEDRWLPRGKTRLWLHLTHSADGRPLLRIGLGPAELIRWIGLRVVYADPGFGWTVHRDVVTREDADDEVDAMVHFLARSMQAGFLPVPTPFELDPVTLTVVTPE